MRASRLLPIALGTLALVAACGPTRPRTEPGASVSTYEVNVLSGAEIEERDAMDMSAFEAVQRLRPNFLRYRGRAGSNQRAGTLLVSVEGGPLRGIEALASIPARLIREIRFLSATDAAQRFGSGASGGPVLFIIER